MLQRFLIHTVKLSPKKFESGVRGRGAHTHTPPTSTQIPAGRRNTFSWPGNEKPLHFKPPLSSSGLFIYIFWLCCIFVETGGLRWPDTYGLLVPGPGTESVSRVLEGAFLTTGPPGSSLDSLLITGSQSCPFSSLTVSPELPSLL